MASEVDICNLALARLGDDATVASIDPPDGSVQADHCKRFYPIARDALLEGFAWGFAIRRATLAAVASAATSAWDYAYARPADALTILAVQLSDAESDFETAPYVVESLTTGQVVIRTDAETATARYVARITDTTKYPAQFVDALAWLLASHVAGPLLKGDAGIKMAQQCYATSMALAGRAAMQDANQGNSQPEHVAPWIGGR